jgi:hypothetical protein
VISHQNRATDRATIIAANDRLRTTFKGGRVRLAPGFYELDDQIWGRALVVMSRQTRFELDSDHEAGHFVFAGYLLEWCVDEAPEPVARSNCSPHRLLTLRVLDDRLIRAAPSLGATGRDNPAV